MNFVDHYMPMDHFLGFQLCRINRKGISVGKTVSMIIVWHSWKHRNNIIFNNKVFDSQELFSTIQVKS